MSDSQPSPPLDSAQPVEAAPANAGRPLPPSPLWLNGLLFCATVLTVFHAGAGWAGADLSWSSLIKETAAWKTLAQGWVFAVPLLSILLAHEFGHYIAARIHRVPASLPFFIPMPIPPFGTMGAVIRMRGRITARSVLLDVGAAGPLAGLIVALPVLVWGLKLSKIQVVSSPSLQEGQCLLYLLLKRLTVGPIPEGSDVFLHPVALAGWTGLFVTMINLLPVGQLDGGHIAFALFGQRQHTIAKWVHGALPVLVAFNLLANLIPHLRAGTVREQWEHILGNSMFWLVWFILLSFLGRAHPPTEPGKLGPVRTAIALGCLLLFVLLFMPTPLSQN